MKGGEAAFETSMVDMEKTQNDYKAYTEVLKKAKGLIEEKKPAEAASLYRDLLIMDQDDALARYLLGRALIAARKYEEAKYEFKRFRSYTPTGLS